MKCEHLWRKTTTIHEEGFLSEKALFRCRLPREFAKRYRTTDYYKCTKCGETKKSQIWAIDGLYGI